MLKSNTDTLLNRGNPLPLIEDSSPVLDSTSPLAIDKKFLSITDVEEICILAVVIKTVVTSGPQNQ